MGVQMQYTAVCDCCGKVSTEYLTIRGYDGCAIVSKESTEEPLPEEFCVEVPSNNAFCSSKCLIEYLTERVRPLDD